MAKSIQIKNLRRRSLLRAGLLAAVCSPALPASALIIYDNTAVDTDINLTQPAGFEDAWARVGTNGNGTGVYLGNGFVLSAAHVTVGTGLEIDGTLYARVGSTSILTNADDSQADLRVYRVAVPEGTDLFGRGILPIVQTSLAGGPTEEGILIGTGVGQTSAQPIQVNPPNSSPGAGFVWADGTTRDKRWGVADIGNAESTPTINGWTAEGFTSAFINGTGDAIAADNDSGAPLFYDNNGTIMLAGLVHGVSRVDFAKIGDETFLSDLSYYASQIQIVEGDLDGDGEVGGSDLELVLDRFGLNVTPGSWLQGDTNGDGVISMDDVDNILAKWTQGPPPASVAVPEPTSLLLIGGAMLATTMRRRRA